MTVGACVVSVGAAVVEVACHCVFQKLEPELLM